MEQKSILETKPTAPGIGTGGMAGIVMCPFFKGVCLRQGCELWVELRYGDTTVARCSLAWLSVLSTETRAAIDKLNMVKPTQEAKNETNQSG